MKRRRKAPKDEADLVRFGVSIPRELIEKFDDLQSGRGLGNRSQCIRELIRANLAQEDWKGSDGQIAATLTLLVDAQKLEAQKRILDCQREMGSAVLSSLHLRVGPREDVWVLVLRGTGEQLRGHADNLLGLTGVQLGKLVVTGKVGG
jgi:CopG family transcriptional regulator, nickel-responsive regulator